MFQLYSKLKRTITVMVKCKMRKQIIMTLLDVLGGLVAI